MGRYGRLGLSGEKLPTRNGRDDLWWRSILDLALHLVFLKKMFFAFAVYWGEECPISWSFISGSTVKKVWIGNGWASADAFFLCQHAGPALLRMVCVGII